MVIFHMPKKEFKEKKCCADCKHCITRYYAMNKKNFYCRLSGKKDKVSGEMNYESCYFFIDTKKCKFEKSYFKLILSIICAVSIIVVSMIYGFLG